MFYLDLPSLAMFHPNLDMVLTSIDYGLESQLRNNQRHVTDDVTTDDGTSWATYKH